MRIVPALVLLAAIFLAGCHKQKPTPSIDSVTEALEKSAEKTLPAPSLADEQVVIPAILGKGAAAQFEEIHLAAQKAGGDLVGSQFQAVAYPSASGTAVQEQLSILATIPENNVEAFKAALLHANAAFEKPSTTTRDIEVLLLEKPSPSPSP